MYAVHESWYLGPRLKYKLAYISVLALSSNAMILKQKYKLCKFSCNGTRLICYVKKKSSDAGYFILCESGNAMQ